MTLNILDIDKDHPLDLRIAFLHCMAERRTCSGLSWTTLGGKANLRLPFQTWTQDKPARLYSKWTELLIDWRSQGSHKTTSIAGLSSTTYNIIVDVITVHGERESTLACDLTVRTIPKSNTSRSWGSLETMPGDEVCRNKVLLGPAVEKDA